MSAENEIRKPTEVPDGLYRMVTFGGGIYHAEKIEGKWFWSDGTGWKSPVEYPEEIIDVIDISGLPEIKKDYNYGELTYPLSDFSDFFK